MDKIRQEMWKSGIIAAIAVIYLVSPIDIVPDALLGLGQMDDLAVVTMAAVQGWHSYKLRKQLREAEAQEEARRAAQPDHSTEVLGLGEESAAQPTDEAVHKE